MRSQGEKDNLHSLSLWLCPDFTKRLFAKKHDERFTVVITLQISIPQRWSKTHGQTGLVIYGEGYKSSELLAREVRDGIPEYPLTSKGHQFMSVTTPGVAWGIPVSE